MEVRTDGCVCAGDLNPSDGPRNVAGPSPSRWEKAMRKDHDDRIDLNKPALIVLCGTTKRKRLPLTGDLIVLGRGAGCDLGLVSPEVAPVHCVIARLGGGWRIRDCS